MKKVRKIELLAPAKNKTIGIEAIRHGADAVYIGAQKFSARSAAGNSLEDIAELVAYAHIYHAKVYVTFNTLLKDSELEEAEKLIWELYIRGVDALIIQDMGILNLHLPPIAIHASTQTDNRTVEKVCFLEKAGISRVVLARELSLNEIKNIATQTSHISLEAFVHGALCTSYSGQCYISQALSGRSANRGECAQYCRLPYTLYDGKGKVVEAPKHLLSLKDLNLSSHLEKLLDAGLTSLKIEGRLKDLSYVKNITAYYRKKLDEIFERRPEYRAASSGETTLFFLPQPEKSFNRGFSDYFLLGQNKDIAAWHSPKSIGEAVGKVNDLRAHYFTFSGSKTVNNGDGLCFINEKKELQGFRVNKAEGNKIYPANMPRLLSGMALYRNYDQEFEKLLSKPSAERKIPVRWLLEENNFGFSLTVTDEDSYAATITYEYTKELAQKEQKQNIDRQLSKLGDTPFISTEVEIRLEQHWFIPSSVLAEMRRTAIQSLLSVRKLALAQPLRAIPATNHPYPDRALDYRGNVLNRKAGEFYRQHGVTEIAPAFEADSLTQVPLMFTKYCLKYQLRCCPKQKDLTIQEPLTLITGSHSFTLRFDCVNCIQSITPARSIAASDKRL